MNAKNANSFPLGLVVAIVIVLLVFIARLIAPYDPSKRGEDWGPPMDSGYVPMEPR